MKLAFVFPGQGSQSVGMLSALAEAEPLVRQTFEQASSAIGVDLWALSQQGPEDQLNRTENTQPALLAAGIAVWRVWLQRGGARPAMMAGHSLGEYTALVAAGAMALEDGIRLVAERGRLMQDAVPAGTGGMAAIIGLDDAAVDEVCANASEGDVVSAANLNSPGQVVIAGSAAAVDRAVKLATEAGARRAIPLAVSVPSHCDLMRPAAEGLAEPLKQIDIRIPTIPVVHNASVSVAESPEGIRDALIRQLYQPVRWVECVTALREAGVSHMAECGPGKVLAGLVRRIDRSLAMHALVDSDSIDAALSDTKVGEA
jgi:[acyl-carrier-protein] S-malonyltransferase